MTDMELTTGFETDTCSCGLTYALPSHYMTARRRDHKFWHCPGCQCSRHFPHESDLEKARREKKHWKGRANSCTARAEHEAHRANGFKGAMRKAQYEAAALREAQ
jgi:hypothetical protein